MKKIIKKPLGELGLFELGILLLTWIFLGLIIYGDYDSNNSFKLKFIFSLGTSIFSALLLKNLLKYRLDKEKVEYTKQFCGKFVRTNIGNDIETTNGKQNAMSDNVGLEIEITYSEPYKVKVKADYWKSINAKVEAELDIIDSSDYTASGKYKYTHSDDNSLEGHEGFYQIHKTNSEVNEYNVLWSQHLPRNLLHNKGYETWRRI